MNLRLCILASGWLWVVMLMPLATPVGVARAAKEELVIGITQFPDTFNPIINVMLAKYYILGMALRPFVAYDQNWELTCMLCTVLPTVENGRARLETLPDGRQGIAVTVDIHPEAKWGDGTPVTTQDVVFAWEVGRHPLTGVANRDAYTRIRAIDVHDEKHFTVHLNRVFHDYPEKATLLPLPAHLERAAFTEPQEYRHRTLYDTDRTNPGLYFGPYRITQVVSGSHVVLEPNPTWWGKPPHFKRIVVRVIENTAALEANLLSGGIDYVAGELGFSVNQALSLERRHRGRFHVIYQPSLIYEHIDLNLDNPFLQDKRVRKALLYAIDREKLVQQLFGGKQTVAHSNVNPLDWIYTDDVPTYHYAPQRAGALLDKAGWHQSRDGVRHNSRGEKLTLQLMTTAGDKTRELVEQVLQSQWKKVGLVVTLKNEPARVFFGQTVARRQYPAMAMYAWSTLPEGVPRNTLHSTAIPSPANHWSGQNTPGFSNAEMDALIEQVEVELNREVRRGYWRRMQHLYAEELPVLPLYFRAEAYVLPTWLTGITPTGHSGTTTLWVEHWGARN